jgi:hypothetical protein
MQACLQSKGGERLMNVYYSGTLTLQYYTQDAKTAENGGGCALQIDGPPVQIVHLHETARLEFAQLFLAELFSTSKLPER